MYNHPKKISFYFLTMNKIKHIVLIRLLVMSFIFIREKKMLHLEYKSNYSSTKGVQPTRNTRILKPEQFSISIILL